MFVQDYGAAYGRNGNKYWGSINGKLLQLRNKEKVEDINFWTKVEQKSIYEVDRIFKSRLQPFEIALFDVESPEWVFTIGESKIIDDKRYVGINKMNKITGATTMIVYFDTETGVIHEIVDYSNDTTTTFLEYQQYGDYFLRSKIKQVGLKNKVESIIEIKELCIGCPIDESLFKKKVIVRASDTPKAKKRRKADLLLNLATGVLYGI